LAGSPSRKHPQQIAACCQVRQGGRAIAVERLLNQIAAIPQQINCFWSRAWIVGKANGFACINQAIVVCIVSDIQIGIRCETGQRNSQAAVISSDLHSIKIINVTAANKLSHRNVTDLFKSRSKNKSASLPIPFRSRVNLPLSISQTSSCSSYLYRRHCQF
jgi:hypothetical protein